LRDFLLFHLASVLNIGVEMLVEGGLQGWPLCEEVRGYPMLDTAGSIWFQPALRWTFHRIQLSPPANLMAPL